MRTRPQRGVKKLPNRRKGHWSHEQRFGHRWVVVLFVDQIGHRLWRWSGLPRPQPIQYVSACCGKGGCTMTLEDRDA